MVIVGRDGNIISDFREKGSGFDYSPTSSWSPDGTWVLFRKVRGLVDHGLVGLDHQWERGPFLLELPLQFLALRDEAVVFFLMGGIVGIVVLFLASSMEKCVLT